MIPLSPGPTRESSRRWPESAGEIKSAVAHAKFKEWALAEGFKENDIPSVKGFVQRLHAHVPTIAVKHKKSGNWLAGLMILTLDRADDPDPGRPRCRGCLRSRKSRRRWLT
jgi:hypothetical protein